MSEINQNINYNESENGFGCLASLVIILLIFAGLIIVAFALGELLS